MQSAYANSDQSVSGNASDGLRKIGGQSSRASSSGSRGAQYDSWKRSYFEALDTVFAPALDAWLACISGQAVIFQPLYANESELVVGLRSAPGANSSLNGVDPDSGVKCKHGGTVLDVNSNQRLTNDDYAVTCKRIDQTVNQKSVRFHTSQKTFRLTMPAVLPPLQPYEEAKSTELLKITGCDQMQVLAAANRPRQLKVSQFHMYSDGSDGNATLAINNEIIVTSSGNRPSGNNRWGTPPSDGYYDVPSGIPIVVYASGGANRGSCIWIHGSVRITP